MGSQRHPCGPTGTPATLLPPEAGPPLAVFAAEFTAPTAARFQTLLAGSLLTAGRRTVARSGLAEVSEPVRGLLLTTLAPAAPAGGKGAFVIRVPPQ